MDLAIIISILSTCIAIIFVAKYLILSNRISELIVHRDFGRELRMLNYSNKLMATIKDMISQIVVMRFKEFMDGHDVTKLTKMQIKGLSENITREARLAINMDSISFDNTLFTEEFIERYIVDISISMVKSVTEKTVEDLY